MDQQEQPPGSMRSLYSSGGASAKLLRQMPLPPEAMKFDLNWDSMYFYVTMIESTVNGGRLGGRTIRMNMETEELLVMPLPGEEEEVPPNLVIPQWLVEKILIWAKK